MLGDTSKYATTVYTSTDRGVSWTIVPNTQTIGAVNFQFLNDQVGFAQGAKTIAVTNDGGKTWNTKNLPTARVMYSQFVSDKIGFYADVTAGIFKSSDRGNTWNLVFNYQDQNQRSPFYFIDSLVGFTLADGNFSKTTDGAKHCGGMTWNLRCKLASDQFEGMHFLDMDHGWACTYGGYVLTLNE